MFTFGEDLYPHHVLVHNLSRECSPSQLLNDLVCVCKVVEQKIWTAHSQSFARPTASRNRNGARAKCFSAGDVVVGIADDINIGGIEIVAMFCLSTFSGKSAELVPIMMVVGESAKFKKIPETIVLKLEFRALLQISGQKREHDVGLWFQSFKELLNSGQDAAARAGK